MQVSGCHQAYSRTTHRKRGMGAPPGGSNANRGRRASDGRKPETYEADYRVSTQSASPSECQSANKHRHYKIRVEHDMRVPPWELSSIYESHDSGERKGGSLDLYA